MNNVQIALTLALVIVGIYLISRIAKDPMAFFAALLRNIVTGCVALLVIDYLGKSVGIHVPLNFASAGVAGVLGVPGVAALAVLEKWII